MKILIADDAAARSTGLRGLFDVGAKAKGSSKKSRAKNQAAASLVVSCAGQKTKSKRAMSGGCSCDGVELSDQPEQSAAILDALGISLLNRGCLKEGGELIEQGLAIRRKAFGPNHPLTAASLNSYARVLRERGDYDDAEAAVNDALRINRVVFGNQGLPVAVNLNELGAIQLFQSRFDEAEKSAIEGLAILKALKLTESDRNTTRLMDVRGRAEKALGRIDEASATFTDLLALDRRQLGTTQHPKYVTHLANFAGVKVAQKNFREAEKYYRQAIDLYLNRLHRPCHPNLIDVYANLSALLRRRKAGGDLQEATELAFKALQLDLQLRGERHELVGNDYAHVGRCQYEIRDFAGSVAAFSQALRVYERNVRRGRFDSQHVFIAEALTWKGRVLTEGGRAAAARQAEPLLERAIQIWPVRMGANSLGEAIAAACLGRALFLQGKDLERARQLLRTAYPLVLKALGADNPLTQRVEAWLKEIG